MRSAGVSFEHSFFCVMPHPRRNIERVIIQKLTALMGIFRMFGRMWAVHRLTESILSIRGAFFFSFIVDCTLTAANKHEFVFFSPQFVYYGFVGNFLLVSRRWTSFKKIKSNTRFKTDWWSRWLQKRRKSNHYQRPLCLCGPVYVCQLELNWIISSERLLKPIINGLDEQVQPISNAQKLIH